MSSIDTRYEHIVLQDSVPVIAGTSMKVAELVAETTAYGWSPEELHFQHPYLTMGQIHSALAYYWDHADEVNREIEQQLQVSDKLREGMESSPLRVRLRAQGLL
ncbi:MAG TPA: DUF433 domain-containing protein [Thermoanaerobaculia bacterium]|nr:DUF433 domain-containing protein [Thermoanaerobaculia bacterium]